MTKAATNMLFDFTYAGVNRRGDIVKGELSSHNMALAKAQLRKQGITVRQIKKKSRPFFEFKPAIKAADIAVFARQLATMIKAGVPLTQSFDIVADTLDNTSMKNLVLKIKVEVESGSTFSDALRQHPSYFDNLFCSFIAAGEQSGSLETMLERIAVYKEKSELLKAKIKKSLKYPILVIIVAITVTLLMLLKVVPVMGGLFSSFDSELPAFTQLILGISDWMYTWWLPLIAAILMATIVFIFAKRHSQTFQDNLDRLILKLPIVGSITYNAIIARFARTLSTTFAAGVPLIDALDSTAGATNNVVFYDAAQQIKNDVATGLQLHIAIRKTNLFPSLAVQMVGIGEESGSLDEMLDKVATYYENDVDNAIDGLTSLIEPIIMVVLGIIVGALVVAMYLPLFQIGAIVS